MTTTSPETTLAAWLTRHPCDACGQPFTPDDLCGTCTTSGGAPTASAVWEFHRCPHRIPGYPRLHGTGLRAFVHRGETPQTWHTDAFWQADPLPKDLR